MSARTKARKRALDILFEADQRGQSVRDVLEQRRREPGRETALPQYSAQIVEGVAQHLAFIDETIATYAQGWPVERMPAVDRAALRLAVWEIVCNDEVDPAVTAAEVTDLVADLSTDESPRFVSGLLSRVIAVRHTLIP